MIIANLLICMLATVLGLFASWRYLRIFSRDKTPTAQAWLVLVATLAWSVSLVMAIEVTADDWLQGSDQMQMYGGNVFARGLFFVFWVGYLLEVKQYCRNRLKRQIRERLKGVKL